jgi:heme/copper-type cytochrome/quinol oxidase subunit 1
VIALLPVWPRPALFDVYLHDTYFVIAPRSVTLGLAVLWAAVAALYFFGDRTLSHLLNDGLTLAHFFLWNFSFIVLFLGSWGFARAVHSHHDLSQSWVLIAGFVAPTIGFIFGGILFLANLTWATILKLKTA